MIRLLLVALALYPLAGNTHEVHTTMSTTQATVITLRYADGEPFSYEQFEVVAEGGTAPVQIGRTDAQGRAAILPVSDKRLNFRATSKDGHGVVLVVDARAEAAVPPAPTFPRWLLVLAGGGVLFGLFGLVQLFVRRR